MTEGSSKLLHELASVSFLIHQIGAGSDGGLMSIGEIIARAPVKCPKIITNGTSDFSRLWEKNAAVAIWLMVEDSYGEKRFFTRWVRRVVNNIRMFSEVWRNDEKVVHINDHRALWNGVFGAKLAGARIIFNVRDGMREGASRSRWRLYLRLCDCFLVLSREMEEHWQEKLAPLSPRDKQKFRKLYSIVDRSRFYPIDAAEREMLRARLGIALDRPALVYIGRFDQKKAQLTFIREVLHLIIRDRPDAVVYFVGDFQPERDPYALACHRAVDELNLQDHVRFVGYTAAVTDWYRAADLLLLASMREGLARCMIEGIACGAPMISFAVCSAREILEEHGCGVVVPLRDYTAFAREALALLNDEAHRAAMAARGPQVAERLFDPERNAAAYVTLLREIAG